MNIDVKQIVEEIKSEIKDRIKENSELSGTETESERFVSAYHSNMIRRMSKAEDIVLFGSGRYGELLYKEFLKDNISTIRCFCDNNERIVGKQVDGLRVLKPEEALMEYPGALFVITVINCPVEITAQLLKMNVDVENILFYNFVRGGF